MGSVAEPIQALALVEQTEAEVAAERDGELREDADREAFAASTFDLRDDPARPADLGREARLAPALATPEEADVATESGSMHGTRDDGATRLPRHHPGRFACGIAQLMAAQSGSSAWVSPRAK